MRHKAVAKAALTCLAAGLLAVGLAGCGGSGSSDESSPSAKAKPKATVVNVDQTEIAASQTMHKGDVLDVTLPSNASTGYSWKFVPDGDGVIEQMGEAKQSSSSDTPGAPGTTTIAVKAVKEGAALITFKEMPPGDSDIPGSVYTMSVEVTAGSQPNNVSINQDYVAHSVTMNQGDTLQVSLADNSGSTGYTWKLESVSGVALQSLGASKIVNNSKLLGGSGVAVFSFKGGAAGQSTMVFSQRAPGTNRIAATWAVTAEVVATAKPVTVTVDNVTAKKGAVTAMMVGDTLIVQLDGRPSDNYGWALESNPQGALVQQGDPVFKPSSDLIGAGGKLTYTFAVKKAGAAQLLAAYHDQSTGSTGPTKQYTFEFEVAAQAEPALVSTSGKKACPLVSANKGDKIELHLHGSSLSDYNWEVAQVETSVLKQAGKPTFKATGSGGSGVVTIPFEAVGAGGTDLVLLHSAAGKAPEATFACRVAVSGQTSHKTMIVAAKQTPQTVELKTDGTLEVNIPGNATTGYQWVDATPDNIILVQDGEPTYKADKTSGGMVGSGGTYTLKWTAAGPGGELVMAQLMPPGSDGGAPASVWSAWVTVSK